MNLILRPGLVLKDQMSSCMPLTSDTPGLGVNSKVFNDCAHYSPILLSFEHLKQENNSPL